MRKILFFLGLCISLYIFGQENLLDTSYGTNNGFTSHTFYSPSGQPAGGFQIHATVKLADGKILAIGPSFFVRFTANGVLDTSFQGMGYKYFYPDRAYDKIEPANDGNYIVMSAGGLLEKIDADGNPVSSFTTLSQLTTFVDFFVDPSGKTYLLRRSNYNYTIIRLLPNGAQDMTFGTNGQIALGSTYRYTRIKVNADNEIFIGGKHEIFVNNRKILMTKLDSNGNIDPSFGTGGHFMYQGGEYVGDATYFEFLDDGKILGFTSGSLCYGNNCFGLIMYRLLPNGTLDTSFKNTGIATMPIQSNSTPSKLQRLEDNTFMLSGTGIRTFYALKMDSDGNLDPSFGLNGKLITPVFGTVDGTPVYNQGFEIYGNSLVFIGIYGIWYNWQQRYIGTLRKYFFNTGSLAVKETEHQKMRIYPNPVKETLYIQSGEIVLGYEIYDMSGKKIDRKNQIFIHSVDVSDLNAGVYLLKLQTGKGTVTSRFLKK
ncbi:T9SS type A sorting domain-containing protein [Chryseobacterium sp. SSA4.19]|uniref:T9SS type A sorting domain-containing protein n=1 Tax=Chryseobacterium sp. SSA4.19 TaxID=2919915 RepID=UPI001F4E4B8D|nr:T9SS type A sorting domain-containing protein [Chryseobacterium sp. SSA4.19]MCJ8153671.1 T9SS type A sorting domain-containing protein [Chryseobacterium sp. SSA4.19]